MAGAGVNAVAAAKFTDLKVRLAASLVLAAVALGAIWAGGVWSALLVGVAAVAMTLELRTITAGGRATLHREDWAYGAVVAAATVAAWAVAPWAGLTALAAGVVALAAVSTLGPGQDRVGLVASLMGTLYIGAAAVAFVALRGAEPYGFLSILWAALVVVAADVGGYFAGRLIGGPKLWSAVSPKKTWAGLGGAVALAFVTGGLFSWATTGTYFHEVCTVSAVAAVLGQGGDLAESALKRHFGVKDAGTLIPGHGGVLDRLDGHMAAVLVAAAVTFWRGQAVFIW